MTDALMTVRISEELKSRLEREAAELELSLSDIVRLRLSESIDNLMMDRGRVALHMIEKGKRGLKKRKVQKR